ncbi:hypothetical protein OS493_032202 [Desmophyllum pertusum]|uniref:Uncharacterized protein n=1 Tax=Desmophyllum pertusum TaxID=174260 RepID=A0A9W9ZXJ3_9CNID|nr:hypothetical protein OS493_032202 [Desmophyllum pertusum]
MAEHFAKEPRGSNKRAQRTLVQASKSFLYCPSKCEEMTTRLCSFREGCSRNITTLMPMSNKLPFIFLISSFLYYQFMEAGLAGQCRHLAALLVAVEKKSFHALVQILLLNMVEHLAQEPRGSNKRAQRNLVQFMEVGQAGLCRHHAV